MTNPRLHRPITVVAATALTVALLSSPAAASSATGGSEADLVADAIAEVAPEASITRPAVDSSGALTATPSSRTGVQFPDTGAQPITATLDSVDVSMGLPELTADAPAVVAEDGTVVYTTGGPADLAVQAVPDGVRVQSVLHDSAAPDSYRYEYPGLTPILNSDGSISLDGVADGLSDEVAYIEAPWEHDAEGRAVPTWFSVEGATVVQHVDHSAADVTYPVVADPTVGFGRGAYVFFNRAETRTIANGGWAATGATGVCAAAGALLGPAGAVAFGAACYAQFGSIVYTAGVAENSRPKKCMRLRWLPGSLTAATYKDSRCK